MRQVKQAVSREGYVKLPIDPCRLVRQVKQFVG
jgi:hypothetical protein